MRFKDRSDAGKQLAKQLMQYKNNPNAIIIGLPRGGVVTAFEVARALELPLDIVVPRKIGAPGDPELAVGALTEDGIAIFNEDLMKALGLTEDDVKHIIDAEKKEAIRRLTLYRGDRAPLNLEDKIVILIDDGIATGATMRAAIASAQKKGAQKIVVAVPVSPPQVIERIKKEVDEIICLQIPEFFWGVGAFYDVFAQTEDEEVIALMKKSAA